MAEKTYTQVATIYREHGVKGYCKLHVMPEHILNLVINQVYQIVSANNQTLTSKLLDFKPHGKFYLAHFEVFKTPEDIVNWRQASISIETTALNREDNQVYDEEWVGVTIKKVDGEVLGTIQSIERTPLKQFLVTRDGLEFYIPCVDEWILEKGEGCIVMDVPEGIEGIES